MSKTERSPIPMAIVDSIANALDEHNNELFQKLIVENDITLDRLVEQTSDKFTITFVGEMFGRGYFNIVEAFNRNDIDSGSFDSEEFVRNFKSYQQYFTTGSKRSGIGIAIYRDNFIGGLPDALCLFLESIAEYQSSGKTLNVVGMAIIYDKMDVILNLKELINIQKQYPREYIKDTMMTEDDIIQERWAAVTLPNGTKFTGVGTAIRLNKIPAMKLFEYKNPRQLAITSSTGKTGNALELATSLNNKAAIEYFVESALNDKRIFELALKDKSLTEPIRMNYVRHNNRLMSDLRYMLAFGIKISVLPENLQRDLKPIKKQLVEEYEGLQQVLPALLSEHALKYDEKSKSFSPHGMTKLPRELKDRIMEFLVDNPHTLSNFTAAEIKEEKEKPLEDRIIRVGSMDSLIKKGDPIPIETAVTTAKYLFRDILESGLLLRSYIPDESWQRYSDNLVKSFDKAGITLTTRSQTHELVFMLFEKGDVISVNRVVEKAIKRFKEDTKHKTPELKLEKDSTEKRLDEDFPEKDKPAKRPNKRKTPYENFGSKVEEDHPDKKSK